MKTPRISEASIQETCADWLALDGWLRRIKTDLRHLRGMGVQEKGIPDDCFIRYATDVSGVKRVLEETGLSYFQELTFHLAAAQVLWIEWKARDGVVGDKQKEWHRIERARGALVVVARVDFDASIEGFQAWYRKSGLMERGL